MCPKHPNSLVLLPLSISYIQNGRSGNKLTSPFFYLLWKHWQCVHYGLLPITHSMTKFTKNLATPSDNSYQGWPNCSQGWITLKGCYINPFN